MQIDLKFAGVEEAIKKLDMLSPRIMKAAVNSLNRTGSAVLEALKAQMPIDFDRPTPYTIDSPRLQRAAPDRLWAQIAPHEWPGKGTPAKKYLFPEIYGGQRHSKRSENALRRIGILPEGYYTVPGAGATIDAYGNQSPGEIRQILSFFNAAEGTLGYVSNMTAKGRAKLARGTRKTPFGYAYFAILPGRGSHLAPGIYRRMNFGASSAYKVSHIQPVLMFVKISSYPKRYRWHETGKTVAMQMFWRYLQDELAKSRR